MEKYVRLDMQFTAAGGYAAKAEAAQISASLGLPERVLDQELHTLSGGQRRRVELARVLFLEQIRFFWMNQRTILITILLSGFEIGSRRIPAGMW